MKKLAVLSLSGGLDSTCLLLWLLSRNYEVHCYSFDYGQKHTIELEKVKKNIELLKDFPITHQIIDLKDCFSDSVSSLSKFSGVEIPKGHYKEDSMRSTVVENRNVIFASIIYGKALSLAKKSNVKVEISLGIHSGDHTIYKDCTPESRLACELAFNVSNWDSDKVSYIAPFETLTKAEVLKKGIESMHKIDLNIMTYNLPPLFFGKKNANFASTVLGNTHTCYNPDEKGRSCGKCGSCIERLEAFTLNNIPDPIEYAEGI